MNYVKAVVAVAVEFDSLGAITEPEIRERVCRALEKAGVKVNDFDIVRYFVSSGDGDPASVRDPA